MRASSAMAAAPGAPVGKPGSISTGDLVTVEGVHRRQDGASESPSTAVGASRALGAAAALKAIQDSLGHATWCSPPVHARRRVPTDAGPVWRSSAWFGPCWSSAQVERVWIRAETVAPGQGGDALHLGIDPPLPAQAASKGAAPTAAAVVAPHLSRERRVSPSGLCVRRGRPAREADIGVSPSRRALHRAGKTWCGPSDRPVASCRFKCLTHCKYVSVKA
jgi:hypothetical protein